MEALNDVDGLVVSQQKEWGEIVSGFETKNKYTVLDTAGNKLYMAMEEEGSTLMRMFLKAARPFKITVRTPDNKTVILADRPFRFYFHEITVYDNGGKLLGSLKKRFSILRRIYTVYDQQHREVFQLFGPLLKPWTFIIKKDFKELGKITKKWSGLLKEGFTDADNFGVTFPVGMEIKLKALFLGAVFLIDFVHFENTGNN